MGTAITEVLVVEYVGGREKYECFGYDFGVVDEPDFVYFGT
jgi:hypothetical protein